MFRVFLDLTYWSVRNQVRVRLRRLRELKYLVAAIVGFGWLGTIVIGPRFAKARPGNHVDTPLQWLLTHPDAARFGIACLLLALALIAVWWPGRRRPLEFTLAEVQFLFPAPITRKAYRAMSRGLSLPYSRTTSTAAAKLAMENGIMAKAVCIPVLPWTIWM